MSAKITQRRQDMFKLADAFFKNIQPSPDECQGIGIDGKRPFGNSYIAGDVLDIIAAKPGGEDGAWSRAQEDYAYKLYDDLARFLRATWRLSRMKGRIK